MASRDIERALHLVLLVLRPLLRNPGYHCCIGCRHINQPRRFYPARGQHPPRISWRLPAVHGVCAALKSNCISPLAILVPEDGHPSRFSHSSVPATANPAPRARRGSILGDNADGAVGLQNRMLDRCQAINAVLAHRHQHVVGINALASQVLGDEVAVVHEQRRHAHQLAAKDVVAGGERGEQIIQSEERGGADHAADERGIRANHRVLDRVGDDEQNGEIEGRELPKLALAREPERHEQEQIDDDAPQDDEQRRRAERDEIAHGRAPPSGGYANGLWSMPKPHGMVTCDLSGDQSWNRQQRKEKARAPMQHTLLWQNDTLQSDVSQAALRAARSDAGALLWIDVAGEVGTAAKMLAVTCGVSRITLDSLHDQTERAKLVQGKDYFYLVAHGMTDRKSTRLNSSHVR